MKNLMKSVEEVRSLKKGLPAESHEIVAGRMKLMQEIMNDIVESVANTKIIYEPTSDREVQ